MQFAEVARGHSEFSFAERCRQEADRVRQNIVETGDADRFCTRGIELLYGTGQSMLTIGAVPPVFLFYATIFMIYETVRN
jgi:hypothetical protein